MISDSSKEIFYDVESNGFSQDENWEAFHSLTTVPKRRKKACCGFDLESSESDTFSLVSFITKKHTNIFVGKHIKNKNV